MHEYEQQELFSKSRSSSQAGGRTVSRCSRETREKSETGGVFHLRESRLSSLSRSQSTDEKDGFFEQPAFQQFSRNVSTPC